MISTRPFFVNGRDGHDVMATLSRAIEEWIKSQPRVAEFSISHGITSYRLDDGLNFAASAIVVVTHKEE